MGTVTRTGLTDLVGNPLDGEFSGQFPTGDGKPGGVFIQDLGVITLTAPLFNSLSLDPNRHFTTRP